MSATIHAVSFNHAPGDVRTGALNVRRNFRRASRVPEWQAGTNNDEIAVYVNDAVDEQSLTIAAEFRGTPGTIEVRAVEATNGAFPLELYLPLVPPWAWAAGIATAFLHAAYLAWQDLVLAGGNVLGEVPSQSITIAANGSSALVPLRLANVRLKSRGIGVHTVTWRWQCRTATGTPWRDAGVTVHTICAIASMPTRPWFTQPFTRANTQLPWTDVLRHACTWARGTRTRADTVRAITEAVFALGTPAGGDRLEYGCPTGAPSMYAFPLFNCTAFLDRIAGGAGAGRFVNCTDCAAFVATFANALGCDLWVSRMRAATPVFRCNPILAIGGKRWQEPCAWPGFTYHEVAWTDDCEADDLISDACAAFSGLTTVPPPGTVPHLAANVRFAGGVGSYRDLLVAPSARAACTPRPAERERRPVF